MTTTIIHIDLDAVDERLAHGGLPPPTTSSLVATIANAARLGQEALPFGWDPDDICSDDPEDGNYVDISEASWLT